MSEKIGRNDPCPCGSGLEFKRCHGLAAGCDLDEELAAGGFALEGLADASFGEGESVDDDDVLADETEELPSAEDAARLRLATALHVLDEGALLLMMAFAHEHLGDAWRSRAMASLPRLTADPEVDAEVIAPWIAYIYGEEEGTLAERFLASEGEGLEDAVRDWIGSASRAVFSIWEVGHVQPEVGVAATDLLTGEHRVLYDPGAARTLVARAGFVARAIEHEGLTVIGGIHPRMLPARGAKTLAATLVDAPEAEPERKLRPEELGTIAAQRAILEAWQSAVEGLDRQSLPDLLDTDTTTTGR